MRFGSLCDHRCRARRAHRTRNLKFMLRRYANASSQRIHRVSKRLHKTCAKPPKTPSSEKSVNWAFFGFPSFLETQRSQRSRAHVSSHQPRPKAAAPHQQWGWLVRAIVVRAPRSRARRRHSAFRMPRRLRPRQPRAKPGGLRRAAPSAPRPSPAQRFAGHGEMGVRGPSLRLWRRGGGSQASRPRNTIRRSLSQRRTTTRHMPRRQTSMT